MYKRCYRNVHIVLLGLNEPQYLFFIIMNGENGTFSGLSHITMVIIFIFLILQCAELCVFLAFFTPQVPCLHQVEISIVVIAGTQWYEL